MELRSNVPAGPLELKWDKHRFEMKLVNPANKRKYTVIVVGSGLAGGSAAATLSELGYNVKCFCFQDSPRRAHSIAAQGGINAAKNYRNDGDSIYRLFYDTVKGGDVRARGSVSRDMVTGAIESNVGDGVVLGTGGYGNVFYLSANAKGSSVTAIWRAHKRGAAFANPCYTQIHPTCIPVSGEYQSKLTLMSESLRNDGRVWVPKKPGETRPPHQIPEGERDYFLERKYPSYGNLAPRDIASRAAKEVCDDGRGVGPGGLGVYLDFADAIKRIGEDGIRERYGNLFDMYERITGENGYKVPMRIYPAVHYTMGGLWVDYNLMSTIPGLFVGGEANFSDHGANRLGASALMQGLADGYFVLPYTVPNYLAGMLGQPVVPGEDPVFRAAEAEVAEKTKKYLSTGGTRSVDDLHREMGRIMWDNCGMARSKEGLEKAISEITTLRGDFDRDLRVLGSADTLNQSLEKAGRVDDFFGLAVLTCRDALHREESCGGHFRVEHQTEDGEALRDDDRFAYAAAWEYAGPGAEPILNKEPLTFDHVHLAQRSYK